MSALSDIIVPALDDPDRTGADSIPATFGAIKAFRDQLAAAIPDDGWLDWTPRLIVHDANGSNSWTPSTGTNPTLGTGSHVEGRYVRVADVIVARATVLFGANSSSVALTTATTTVSGNKFTQASSGLSNGMAFIPSSLGTTTLTLPSLNQDGSYYVVGVSGDDWQAAQTPGGSVVPMSGSNATGVHIDAVAVDAGSGPYRLSLPVACASAQRAVTARADIGYGTIYNDSTAQATFGLGPNVYRHVDLHTAETISTDVGGLLNTAGLPTTSFQGGGYTVTTPVTNRAFTTTSVTTEQLAQVVGTMLSDLAALLAENVLVDVADNSPWVWAANDRIGVKMFYEAA